MRTTWLLSAACCIALLASAPAWAQSTMTAPKASSSMGMAKPMAPMKHHKKSMAMGKPKDVTGPSAADHSADMLNDKEMKSPMSPSNPS